MCTVSDQLKLCTCTTQDVTLLKHYWILYQYQKSDIIMMGTPLLPQEYEIGKTHDDYNKTKLATLLNERHCFDTDLPLKNNDILELNFSHTPDSNPETTIPLVYEFVYKKNRWVAQDYDPFDTDRLQKEQGKIRNPFA